MRDRERASRSVDSSIREKRVRGLLNDGRSRLLAVLVLVVAGFIAAASVLGSHDSTDVRIAYVDHEQAFAVLRDTAGDLRKRAADTNAEILQLQQEFAVSTMTREEYTRRLHQLQAELLAAQIEVDISVAEHMLGCEGFKGTRGSLEELLEQLLVLAGLAKDLVAISRMPGVDATEFATYYEYVSSPFPQLDLGLTDLATGELDATASRVAQALNFEVVVSSRDVIFFDPAAVCDVSDYVAGGIRDLLSGREWTPEEIRGPSANAISLSQIASVDMEEAMRAFADGAGLQHEEAVKAQMEIARLREELAANITSGVEYQRQQRALVAESIHALFAAYTKAIDEMIIAEPLEWARGELQKLREEVAPVLDEAANLVAIAGASHIGPGEFESRCEQLSRVLVQLDAIVKNFANTTIVRAVEQVAWGNGYRLVVDSNKTVGYFDTETVSDLTPDVSDTIRRVLDQPILPQGLPQDDELTTQEELENRAEPMLVNAGPIPNAGRDAIVDVGEIVTLDASRSYDSDGDPLGYSWTQSKGPRVEVSNSHSPTAGFKATQAGTYVFELVVDDGDVTSEPDSVVVTAVSPDGEGESPVGRYLNPLNADDCLEVESNGSCYMEILGLNMGATGSWRQDTERISMVFHDGTTLRGILVDDAILLEGFGMLPVVWVRPERTPPRAADTVGSYAKEGNPDEQLVLNSEHAFTLSEVGFTGQLLSSSGEWDLERHVITLWRSGDRSLGLSAAVLDDRLYFTGLFGTDVWVKQASPKRPSGDRLDEPEEESILEDAPPTVEWERVFNSSDRDEAVMVQQTADGGFIVLANSMREAEGYPIEVIWLIKTDEAGNKQWEQIYGGIEDGCEARGSCVRQTHDGGFIVAGTAEIDQGDSAWLIKTDRLGEKEWHRMIGGGSPQGSIQQRGASVQQTSDNGYILIGEIHHMLSDDNGNVSLSKISRTGDIEWKREFGGSWRDWGLWGEQAKDDGYILIGITYRGSGWDDLEGYILLIKTDEAGNKEWDQLYGDYSIEDCQVRLTEDGGFALAANIQDFSTLERRLWLAELSPAGGVQWNATYSAVDEGATVWITETPPGGYVICTSRETLVQGLPASVLWVLRTDEVGNTHWTSAMDRLSRGASVEPTTDGGYIVLGTTLDDVAGDDVWLLKFSSDQTPHLEPPIAHAGPDQTINDADGDGEEEIGLDGSSSMDPDGGITRFAWSEDGREIAVGESPVVTLPVGSYRITLTVTDDDGLTSQDEVAITIAAPVLSCAIELRQQGLTDPAGTIRVYDRFDISMSTSEGGISRIRFSSDEEQDGDAEGDWTEWHDWNSLTGDWNGKAKTMDWSFATEGEKEIWAEIQDSQGSSSLCSAQTEALPPLWRQYLEVGDILYDPCTLNLSPFVDPLDLLDTQLGHVGIYVGDGLTADPRLDGILHHISTWDRRGRVQILRVSCPDDAPHCAQAAARWARELVERIGVLYRYQCPVVEGILTGEFQKSADPIETEWYCSELVWAAYLWQGVDIEAFPGNISTGLLYNPYVPVSPNEICEDGDTFPVGGHTGGEPVVILYGRCDCSEHGILQATCPVDLVLHDEEGRKLSKNQSEIPSSFYWVDDFDSDGSMDSRIVFRPADGEYKVEVIPRASAGPTDTFTLVYSSARSEDWAVLADSVRIRDIPEEPYRIRASSGVLSTLPQGGADVPATVERHGPDTLLLVVLIAAAVSAIAVVCFIIVRRGRKRT